LRLTQLVMAASQSMLQPMGNGQLSSGQGQLVQNQHALMSAAMTDAKRARLKAENDREALANRIGRLQLEQVRAEKRIEQTHRRTKEILGAKDRHQKFLIDQEKLKATSGIEIEEHRAALREMRDETRQSKNMIKMQQAAEREMLVRANKESAVRNYEAIQHQRAAELNHAMFKRNEVRRIEADARERRLREKELMIAHQQQRADERSMDEKRSCEDLDQQLSDLERQEFELLLALEGHKSERDKVYEQLESQLGSTSALVVKGPAPGGMPPMS